MKTAQRDTSKLTYEPPSANPSPAGQVHPTGLFLEYVYGRQNQVGEGSQPTAASPRGRSTGHGARDMAIHLLHLCPTESAKLCGYDR